MNHLFFKLALISFISISCMTNAANDSEDEEQKPKKKNVTFQSSSILIPPTQSNKDPSSDDSKSEIKPYNSEEEKPDINISFKNEEYEEIDLSSHKKVLPKDSIVIKKKKEKKESPDLSIDNSLNQNKSKPEISLSGDFKVPLKSSKNHSNEKPKIKFSISSKEFDASSVAVKKPSMPVPPTFKRTSELAPASEDPKNKSLATVTYRFGKSGTSNLSKKHDDKLSFTSSSMNSSSSSSPFSLNSEPNDDDVELESVEVNLMQDISGLEDDYYRCIIPFFRITEGWADFISNACGWSATILAAINLKDFDPSTNTGINTAVIVLGVVSGVSGGYALYSRRAKKMAQDNLKEVLEDHFSTFDPKTLKTQKPNIIMPNEEDEE